MTKLGERDAPKSTSGGTASANIRYAQLWMEARWRVARVMSHHLTEDGGVGPTAVIARRIKPTPGQGGLTSNPRDVGRKAPGNMRSWDDYRRNPETPHNTALGRYRPVV